MAKRSDESKPAKTALARAQEILSRHKYDGNEDWEAHWFHLKSIDIIHIARSLEITSVATVEDAAGVFNRLGFLGAADWTAIHTPAGNVVQSESKVTMHNERLAIVIARGLMAGDAKGGA
jgi:hypothetical protein